jgi:hypothetical protein
MSTTSPGVSAPTSTRCDTHWRQNLALAGTPPRVAIEIMRHSDMRLTAKTYTDAGLLAVWDKVANLPSFTTGHLVKDSQIDSHSSKIVDSDLQWVINAWRDLPANLKAAILAIAGSS